MSKARSNRDAQRSHDQVDGEYQVRERRVDSLIRQSQIMLEEVAWDIHIQRYESGDPAQGEPQHRQSPEFAAVEAKEWAMATDQCPDVLDIVEQKHSQPDSTQRCD